MLCTSLKTSTKDHFLWTRPGARRSVYQMRARAHNWPTFARGSGSGLGFIAVASKAVYFACNRNHGPGTGTRVRRWCVHSKLLYTYVCTLFTSFLCYIEFYVDMEDLAMDDLVAPNGRHNLFKCSMCDIFCIVRNMLPPQYLFETIRYIFSIFCSSS